jgi:hypothetical protein
MWQPKPGLLLGVWKQRGRLGCCSEALWYWKSKGCWVTSDSASLLDAELKWKKEMTRSSWRKRCVETKEAMVDLRIEI